MGRFSLGFEFRLLPDKNVSMAFASQSYHLCVGSHVIPHPNKVDSCWKLICFVSIINLPTNCYCFFSWADEDVGPSLFSRELIANASSFVPDEEVALAY
ncbi:unnamed protein product [Linum tenue]|uniref:Uncharacterized protein n=1 Tax=Linum tenue TaxID=586396 RepID=A0AAV0H9G0_9ROSI|nr:unnamed protein product [Linum tenue]